MLSYFARGVTSADDQPAGAEGPRQGPDEDEEPGPAEQPAEAGRVRARVHADPEEAELGASEGRAREAHERERSDDLYPGCRPQPPGALVGADSWWSCQGPPRRALPRGARLARCGWRGRPHAGSLEIRREAAEEGVGRRYASS